MKTVNLRRKHLTLDELLQLVESYPVRIVTGKGRAFILEQADDFDKEVKMLGRSKKFKAFLDRRSKEPSTTSLGDYRKSLEQ